MQKIALRLVLFLVWTTAIFPQSFLPVYQRGSMDFEANLEVSEKSIEKEYVWNKPLRLNIDEGGNMHLLDFKEDHIIKFDAKGNFLYTIGTKGRGPGELKGIKHAINYC